MHTSSALSGLAKIPVFVFLILLLCPNLKAEKPNGKCVNADFDALVFETGFMPDPDGELQFPEFKFDANGLQLTTLKWIPLPSGISITSKVIAHYHGHEIVDVTYTGKMPDSDNPAAPFVWKILAFRENTGVSGNLQPFFISSGENVRYYEQVFNSDNEHPFSLRVAVTMPGNGVFWSNYTFLFSTKFAWLSARTQGGRKVKTTTTTFSSSGNVIHSSVSGEN